MYVRLSSALETIPASHLCISNLVTIPGLDKFEVTIFTGPRVISAKSEVVGHNR